MKNLTTDQLVQLWNDYGVALLLGAGLLGLLFLLVLVIYARKTGKRLRPITLSVSMNLALLLNAEGMWVVAQDKLNLPPQFAILVFAVFEILFLNATGLAAERYRATTVRDSTGKIITAGHPGKMVWVAFGIAVFSGLVVASNAPSATEKMLRLGIPVTIFAMWWAALTAEGQTARRGRFAHSPRRIAERRGWIIGDEDPEFQKLAHDRAVKKIVVYADRMRSGLPPARLWEWRAARLARTATQEVTADVLDQLYRQDRFMDLLAPGWRSARGQNPLLLPPGATAGQTPATERAEGRADRTADADTAPLPEDDTAGAGPVEDGPEQTPRDHRTDGPDTRAHGTNGHRTDSPPAGVSATWPLAQRAGEEAPLAAAEQPAGSPTEPNERTGPAKAPLYVSSAQWRPAVERLSAAAAAQMRPNDGNLTGRGMRELSKVLGPYAPELSAAHLEAFIRDWWDARAGLTPKSGLPWGDLLPQQRPEVGSPQWLEAAERLSQELADTLRPEDMRGQSGRGAIQLGEMLAPKVPELDKEAVIAFIGDYVLAMSGQLPMSGLPWTNFLPASDPITGLPDDELLRRFGEQLRDELRTRGRLTGYRVGQVTRAGRRQADRILDLILEEHRLSMSGGPR